MDLRPDDGYLHVLVVPEKAMVGNVFGFKAPGNLGATLVLIAKRSGPFNGT